MRPAELAPARIEVAVGPPAVGADDRLRVAKQRLGLLAVARPGDPERGRLVAEGAPEEARLARLLPAGLIDADDRRAANSIAKPFLGLAQGRAGTPDDRVDGADRDLQPEQLVAELRDLAAREPKAGGEGGDGSVKARTEATLGNIRGKLRLGDRAAVGAAPPGEPVLADPDRDLRQLRDLVAAGRCARRPTGQGVTARSALLGEVLEDLVDLLDRQQPATRTRMARLPAGLALGALALGPALRGTGTAEGGSEELSESRRSSRSSSSSRSTRPSSRST
jgi:hypothetical protein